MWPSEFFSSLWCFLPAVVKVCRTLRLLEISFHPQPAHYACDFFIPACCPDGTGEPRPLEAQVSEYADKIGTNEAVVGEWNWNPMVQPILVRSLCRASRMEIVFWENYFILCTKFCVYIENSGNTGTTQNKTCRIIILKINFLFSEHINLKLICLFIVL
jgi:hypothetical protein